VDQKRTAFTPTHCTRSPEQRWARAVVIKGSRGRRRSTLVITVKPR